VRRRRRAEGDPARAECDGRVQVGLRRGRRGPAVCERARIEDVRGGAHRDDERGGGRVEGVHGGGEAERVDEARGGEREYLDRVALKARRVVGRSVEGGEKYGRHRDEIWRQHRWLRTKRICGYSAYMTAATSPSSPKSTFEVRICVDISNQVNAQRSARLIQTFFKMPKYIIQTSTDLQCANRSLCVRANVTQAAVVVQLEYLESIGGRKRDEEIAAYGMWTRVGGTRLRIFERCEQERNKEFSHSLVPFKSLPLTAMNHALRVAPHNAMRFGRRIAAGFRLRQRADAECLAESHGQQRRGLVQRRGEVGAELVQV
jgi:hypothetical protein